MIEYITYLILTYSVILYTTDEAEKLAKEIITISETYNQDVILVTALIARESGFDQSKVNKKTKAFGLMQLHPKWSGKNVPKHDRVSNLDKGVAALQYYKKHCGGVPTKAIAAYRLGEDGCNTIGSQTKKVMKLYRKWNDKYYSNLETQIGDVLIIKN